MKISAAEASLATMNRGAAYQAKGDLDKALRDFDEAIRLDPHNAGAYVDRGLVRSIKGAHDEALTDFEEAIRLNPNQWEAYYNRTTDLWDAGKRDEIVADLTRTMELNPSFPGAYARRADIYFRKGEVDRAISDYTKAIDLDPKVGDLYMGRAQALVRRKRCSEAVRDLERAEQPLGQRSAATLNSLGWLRATSPVPMLRNGKKAIEMATKACALTDWKKSAYIDTLAAAYAEAGDFAQAAKYESWAISMTDISVEARAGAQKRLALYKKGKPYREE